MRKKNNAGGEKRRCKKCGYLLSIYNKKNVCFHHSTAAAEKPTGWPVAGSSSGSSGDAARYTQIIEEGQGSYF